MVLEDDTGMLFIVIIANSYCSIARYYISNARDWAFHKLVLGVTPN